MILKRLRNAVEELTKTPIDRPRDEFRYTFRGGIFRPVLRCTVCDTRSGLVDDREVAFGHRFYYRCPSCGTEGSYQISSTRTRLKNLYPEEWEENPYDTHS